ncbi:MAG: diacylglycerol kinase family protein [Alphaproteobacteria bacterium]
MFGTKTRVALIHNAAAGDASHGRDWLLDVLSRAGYEVEYHHHKNAAIDAALDSAAALIVVAGGDGTVAQVAARARPDGPPIAILPLGTANNIAASLGLGGDIEGLVAGWRGGAARPFYPIDCEGPWGRRRLVEGLGFGAIEEAIADLPDTVDHEAACRGYAREVMTDDPELLELTIDDGETICERFAVLEIAAIPLVGPNLNLAPTANPSGRHFAVSFIRDTVAERRSLAAWIIAPRQGEPPPVIMRRAARATIAGRFQRVRIDGDVHTAAEEPGWDLDAPITLTSAAEPIRFLIPG